MIHITSLSHSSHCTISVWQISASEQQCHNQSHIIRLLQVLVVSRWIVKYKEPIIWMKISGCTAQSAHRPISFVCCFWSKALAGTCSASRTCRTHLTRDDSSAKQLSVCHGQQRPYRVTPNSFKNDWLSCLERGEWDYNTWRDQNNSNTCLILNSGQIWAIFVTHWSCAGIFLTHSNNYICDGCRTNL